MSAERTYGTLRLHEDGTRWEMFPQDWGLATRGYVS